MFVRIGVFMVILMLMIQIGCAIQPTPTPSASGHVTYDLSATLDGKPLPLLQAIRAESCYDGYGGYLLSFTATADMIPEAIDDEIVLGLNIQIDDISKITLGSPIDIKNNSNIHLSASARVFVEGPQDPLMAATGTITIAALSEREMSGSASLVFTDPNDVNPAVKDMLAFEMAFTNLAIVQYCPES